MTGQVALSEVFAIAGKADTKPDAQTAQELLAAAVREHARFLFKVAYSVVRNAHDAEDVVQETFLRAMRHQREFAGVSDRRAWLARTAWRIAIDRVRRHPVLSLDDEANTALLAEIRELESGDFGSGMGVSAEKRLISGQMIELLRSLIAALPSDLRDVLTLSTVEEMTSAGIAALLGIPESSVRTRQMRARQLLKEKFTALLDEPRRGNRR